MNGDVPRFEHELPSGAVRRLTEHYGDAVSGWLERAPAVLVAAADRWELNWIGYHDVGWTSLVVACRDARGEDLLIKALPERDRFLRERAALDHWAGRDACRLRDADDGEQLLLVGTVPPGPGGAPRPADHAERVARRLRRLHERPATGSGAVPLLTDYYRYTVVPRMDRRAQTLAAQVGDDRVWSALRIATRLSERVGPSVMLHSDLYAENVLFDPHQRPVFIDPHPVVGSPAFDWAFWCVYYEPTGGFAERVRLCRGNAEADMTEILEWVVTLAVDGALYYLDTNDATASAMLDVLDTPAVSAVAVSE